MIAYQLRCSSGHEFEAWFRNSAGCDEQCAAGDISCPMCGNPEVCKALMAPAIGKKANAGSSQPPQPSQSHEKRAAEVAREVLDAMEKVEEHVKDNCDYVGTAFAEEVRKIYYGETERRSIYGEATDEDSRALLDEGIEVFRVPTPPKRKNN